MVGVAVFQFSSGTLLLCLGGLSTDLSISVAILGAVGVNGASGVVGVSVFQFSSGTLLLWWFGVVCAGAAVGAEHRGRRSVRSTHEVGTAEGGRAKKEKAVGQAQAAVCAARLRAAPSGGARRSPSKAPSFSAGGAGLAREGKQGGRESGGRRRGRLLKLHGKKLRFATRESPELMMPVGISKHVWIVLSERD